MNIAMRKFNFSLYAALLLIASGLPAAAQNFSTPPGAAGRKLVLATCWPLDAKTAGPMRYLVHAEMMDQAAGPSADVDR